MMNNKMLLSALILTVGAGFASAQQTFDFSAVSINSVDAFGDADNTVLNGPTVGTAYVLGTSVTVQSLTLTEVATATFASEFSMGLYNSAYPGYRSTFTATATTSYTGTFILAAPAVRALAGALGNQLMPAGSTWKVEFAESAQDGTAGLAEQVATNLVFDTQVGTALPALPSTNINFVAAGPFASIDAAGDVNNAIITGPTVANDTVVGNTWSLRSSSWAQAQTGDFPSHTSYRVRQSGAPTLFLDVVPFGSMAYDPAILNPAVATTSTVAFASTNTSTGTIVGSLAPAGSTFTLEVFQTSQTGTADIAEANISNIDFGLTSSVLSTGLAFNLAGTFNSVDLVGDPDNVIVNLTPTVPAGASYRVGSILINSGTLTQVNTSSTAIQMGMRLRNSAFPYMPTDVLLTTSSFSAGSVTLGNAVRPFAKAVPIIGLASGLSTLQNVLIPAASTWTAEFYETTDNIANGPDASVTNLNFKFVDGTAFSAVAPTAEDLGAINDTTAPVGAPLFRDVTFGIDEIKWYKFSISDGLTQGGSKFLDIYTRPTATSVNSLNDDTEIALFDANGRLIFTSDDYSGTNQGNGLMSAISVGDATTPRSYAVSAPATAPTAPAFLQGNSLEGLVAGTYYLAYGRYNIDHGQGFQTVINPLNRVDNASLAPQAVRIHFRSNIVGQSFITGNLALQNTADDGAAGTENIGWTLSDGVNTYNGTVSVDDFGGGAYSITIPGGAPNGAYTLRFKGGTFLASAYSVVLNGSNLTQNASLRNGNIDQDTEVGPSDFEAVVTQFGGPGDADCDNDGEVGPSDFEIVNANFSLEDE